MDSHDISIYYILEYIIPFNTQPVLCNISYICSFSLFFYTFLFEIFIIIYVLIDFSSSESFKILYINLYDFYKGKTYMVVKKSL